jgi:hypothetical protein
MTILETVGSGPSLIPLLVATGLLTALSETVRWWLQGRGRQKVDQAQIVQGMALNLLAPLHAELDEASRSAVSLRAQLRDIEAEMESVIGWALYARNLLDAHSIEYRPVPAAVQRRVG